jgi:hypothetical protein
VPVQAPTIYALQHDGALADVAVADVNGDRRGDLCALSMCDSVQDGAWLSVYLSRADGTYPKTADCRYALPDSIGGAFFAETNGAAPTEVVAVDTTGAYILGWRGGELAELARPRFLSLFPAGLTCPKFLENQVVDLDRDGVHEWLVPLPHGYALRSANAELATIGCHVVGAVARDSASRTHLRYEFPGVVPFPWESEVHEALAFINTHTVEFARGPGWDKIIATEIPFKEKPESLSRAQSGGYADTFPKPPKPEAHAELHDLNDDGLPDLLITEAEGSINIETTTRVHFARPGCTFSEKPDVTFVKSGAFAQPTVIDVNGDGKKDIFFFQLSFGLKSMVSYFVREKVTLRLEAHLYSEDGFRDDAEYTSKFTLDAQDNSRTGVLALGDFTGDGRMDAAFSLEGERLGLFEGRGEDLISEDPVSEFDIPPYGTAKTCDLDGDRAQDIVVFEPGREEASRIHVAVF